MKRFKKFLAAVQNFRRFFCNLCDGFQIFLFWQVLAQKALESKTFCRMLTEGSFQDTFSRVLCAVHRSKSQWHEFWKAFFLHMKMTWEFFLVSSTRSLLLRNTHQHFIVSLSATSVLRNWDQGGRWWSTRRENMSMSSQLKLMASPREKTQISRTARSCFCIFDCFSMMFLHVTFIFEYISN